MMKKFALPILLMLTFLSAATVQSATTTNVWTATFTLEIYKRAIPTTSTNTITIDVIKGSSDTLTAALNLSNLGNNGIGYSIDSDFSSAIIDYSTNYTQNTLGWVPFTFSNDSIDTNQQFTGWSTNGTSASMSIGFSFPFYGTSKTQFSVGTHGAINLNGGDVPENPEAIFSKIIGFFDLKDLGMDPSETGWGPDSPITVSTDPIVAPFWSTLSVDTNNVRFKKESDRLVVTWEDVVNQQGNGTSGLRFQAHLHDDGRITYFYKFYEDPGTGLVGLWNGSDSSVTASAFPQNYQLNLTPVSWVSLGSLEGTLSGSTTQSIPILVSGETVDSNSTFPITVNWSDGTSTNINIAINAIDPTYSLAIIPSNNISFETIPNDIETTDVSFANTGDAPLRYNIDNPSAQSGGYTWQTTDYNWDTASFDASVQEDFSPEDQREGVSQLIPIGFEFPFYGTVYTNLSVGVNGGISLGESLPMYTYHAWLYYDTRDQNWWRTVWDDYYAPTTGGELLSFRYVVHPYFFNKLDTTTHSELSTSVNARYVPYTEQWLTADAPVRPQFIAPYWADLEFSTDSSIQIHGDNSKLIITWENMTQWSKQPLFETSYKEWYNMPMTISANDAETTAPIAHDLTFQAVLHKDGTIVYQYQSLDNPEAWTNAIIGIRDTATRVVDASLANAVSTVTLPDDSWDGTLDGLRNYLSDSEFNNLEGIVEVSWPISYILINQDISIADDTTDTTGTLRSTGELNWQMDEIRGYPVVLVETANPVAPFTDATGRELDGTTPTDEYNIQTVTKTKTVAIEEINEFAIKLTPNTTSVISLDSRTGFLMPNQTKQFKIIGNAREIDAPATFNSSYSVVHDGGSTNLNVEFKVDYQSGSLMKDSDGDGLADALERRWGTDEFDPDSTYKVNLDGSRTITWTAPSGTYGDIDRTYLIQYTTDLTTGWTDLITVTNETTFTDTVNVDEPQVYYRVLADW